MSFSGKFALDASNPIPARDDEMATEALARGNGVASPQFLPDTRIVRVFNCAGYSMMKSEAHGDGEKLGIPLAASDQEALRIAVGLVRDAGFEPVVVGGLERAKNFDYGTPIFGKPMVAAGCGRPRCKAVRPAQYSGMGCWPPRRSQTAVAETAIGAKKSARHVTYLSARDPPRPAGDLAMKGRSSA